MGSELSLMKNGMTLLRRDIYDGFYNEEWVSDDGTSVLFSHVDYFGPVPDSVVPVRDGRVIPPEIYVHARHRISKRPKAVGNFGS